MLVLMSGATGQRSEAESASVKRKLRFCRGFALADIAAFAPLRWPVPPASLASATSDYLITPCIFSHSAQSFGQVPTEASFCASPKPWFPRSNTCNSAGTFACRQAR